MLPHVPTVQSRAEVCALVSYGVRQEEICKYIDIKCVDTLYKYYRKELDTSVIKANAAVAGRLYNKAVGQDDLSAQIFWLKTRARWRTNDVDKIVNDNDKMQKELDELRAKLDATHEKDY